MYSFHYFYGAHALSDSLRQIKLEDERDDKKQNSWVRFKTLQAHGMYPVLQSHYLPSAFSFSFFFNFTVNLQSQGVGQH